MPIHKFVLVHILCMQVMTGNVVYLGKHLLLPVKVSIPRLPHSQVFQYQYTEYCHLEMFTTKFHLQC